MAVKPIPEGYHTLTPYLIVKGAAAALEFYAKAFGAQELFRMADPSGKVGHAEMKIGDSRRGRLAGGDGASRPTVVIRSASSSS